jgi:heme/copper-type cytochrome/quinol oxidase subunit 3
MAAPAVSLPRPRPLTEVPNAVIGMLIFLGTETMFFAGLVSAFLVLRAGSLTWPPPGQPRLPGALTALNTLMLLCSGYTMWRAVRAIRYGQRDALIRGLRATALMGIGFVVVQGSEWVSLLHYGFAVSSGPYATTFYTLIGCHGLHVLGGVLVLLSTAVSAGNGRYTSQDYAAVEACALYWWFVVGVWPVLYALVYWA